VDFVRADLTRKVRVNVPVRLIGGGGRSRTAACFEFMPRGRGRDTSRPIPEHLDLDVTALRLNQHLR
jgi:hypothetical protein